MSSTSDSSLNDVKSNRQLSFNTPPALTKSSAPAAPSAKGGFSKISHEPISDGGQVIVGIALSTIVMVNMCSTSLPQSSVAVIVISFVPTWNVPCQNSPRSNMIIGSPPSVVETIDNAGVLQSSIAVGFKIGITKSQSLTPPVN